MTTATAIPANRIRNRHGDAILRQPTYCTICHNEIDEQNPNLANFHRPCAALTASGCQGRKVWIEQRKMGRHSLGRHEIHCITHDRPITDCYAANR